MAALHAPAAAAHPAATALVGGAVAVVGVLSQEQAAQWVGLGLVAWSGLMACYAKWLDVRREARRRDLEAELAAFRSRIEAARSELSGLEIHRNQIAVEEGR